MKIEKHVEDLIALLKDVRKEPSPAVVGFAYSTAAIHIFSIVFHDELDPGRMIKHDDFRSEKDIRKLKSLIRDFDKKDELFLLWKEMENKRNELCYGYPKEEDIKEYTAKFYKIKEILENISDLKFEIDFLEKYLAKIKGGKNE